MSDTGQTDAQGRAARAFLPLLAIGGLATAADAPAAANEAVEAAAKEAERLAALGKAFEAFTGQRGPAAMEMAKAWRDGSERVPSLVKRVKVEALQGRLAAAYPPAQRFALNGEGIPSPAAGPHPAFDEMGLDVFDARTASGTVHPAIQGPPAAAPSTAATLTDAERAECARLGITEAAWLKARTNLYGGPQ